MGAGCCHATPTLNPRRRFVLNNARRRSPASATCNTYFGCTYHQRPKSTQSARLRADHRAMGARGLDRLHSEFLSQAFGQGRPRVSAAWSNNAPSEAEPRWSDAQPRQKGRSCSERFRSHPRCSWQPSPSFPDSCVRSRLARRFAPSERFSHGFRRMGPRSPCPIKVRSGGSAVKVAKCAG